MRFTFSEFGLTQNWFQKVVSRDHPVRLRRQNSIRSEQQIDVSTPVKFHSSPDQDRLGLISYLQVYVLWFMTDSKSVVTKSRTAYCWRNIIRNVYVGAMVVGNLLSIEHNRWIFGEEGALGDLNPRLLTIALKKIVDDTKKKKKIQ